MRHHPLVPRNRRTCRAYKRIDAARMALEAATDAEQRIELRATIGKETAALWSVYKKTIAERNNGENSKIR